MQGLEKDDIFGKMEDFDPGKELEVICFFQEVPVRGKIFLLYKKEDLSVWKTSFKFLAIIAYSGEFFAKVGNKLFQFEVLSIDDKEVTFTTQQPRLINEEILNRQTLRVTISEGRRVKLLIGEGKNIYEHKNQRKSLSYFSREENTSYSLILNVHDMSVGGIGLLFKGDVKAFKPGKKIRMRLLFFRKIGGGTEIKEREIPILGEIVRKEKIVEDIIKVGIRFLDLESDPEHYRFVFDYVIRRQREIRKQMEYLMSEI